jgi:hypothetical protein
MGRAKGIPRDHIQAVVNSAQGCYDLKRWMLTYRFFVGGVGVLLIENLRNPSDNSRRVS